MSLILNTTKEKRRKKGCKEGEGGTEEGRGERRSLGVGQGPCNPETLDEEPAASKNKVLSPGPTCLSSIRDGHLPWEEAAATEALPRVLEGRSLACMPPQYCLACSSSFKLGAGSPRKLGAGAEQVPVWPRLGLLWSGSNGGGTLPLCPLAVRPLEPRCQFQYHACLRVRFPRSDTQGSSVS